MKENSQGPPKPPAKVARLYKLNADTVMKIERLASQWGISNTAVVERAIAVVDVKTTE